MDGQQRLLVSCQAKVRCNNEILVYFCAYSDSKESHPSICERIFAKPFANISFAHSKIPFLSEHCIFDMLLASIFSAVKFLSLNFSCAFIYPWAYSVVAPAIFASNTAKFTSTCEIMPRRTLISKKTPNLLWKLKNLIPSFSAQFGDVD